MSQINPAMITSIEVLKELMKDVSATIEEAYEAAQSGNNNRAAGTLISLEKKLPQANTIFESILILHCMTRSRS